MKIRLETTDPEAFVKRAYKLAYDACGGPFGMGILQARGQAGEEDVFRNVISNADYPRSGESVRHAERAKNGDFYGDYVFGRMMKLGMRIREGVVEIWDGNWDREYNAFIGEYPNGEALTKATLISLGDRDDAYSVVEEKATV